MTATTDSNEVSFLHQLARIRRTAPVVFHTLAVLLAYEGFMAFIVPIFMPKERYLRLYLSDRAVVKMRDIVEDRDDFLIWDDLLGWKNRPNSGQGVWSLDENGARTTHPIPTEEDGRRRVLFLGNSLTNGGMHVANDETISAYVEDSLTESLNFATMLYSVDQMALAFEALRPHRGSILVVGIPGEPFLGLRTRYIPFLFRDEENMPYIKPRFVLDSSALTLIPPPTREVFEGILDSSFLLDRLEDTDDSYRYYDQYRRFGFTPVLGTGWSLYKKARRLERILRGDDARELEAVARIMLKLTRVAEDDETRVIFMVLPDSKTTFPPALRRVLPDQYGQLVSNLLQHRFQVLDVRKVLRESKLKASELFSSDEIHYTPAANRIIAEALKLAIDS